MTASGSTSYPFAIDLDTKAVIARPPAAVFHFLTTRIPEVYRQLSPAHERYNIQGGGPLTQGAVIDCREQVSNQEVHHRYVVEELVGSRLIRYASRPSQTWIHLGARSIEGECATTVLYQLRPLDDSRTELAMTIRIAWATRFERLMARTVGRARAVWGAHQCEELAALVSLIEAEDGLAVAGQSCPVKPDTVHSV